METEYNPRTLERIKQKTVRFIRDSVNARNKEGGVIGLSGGLDSSVTAYLMAEALGVDKTLGITLTFPEFREQDLYHAKSLASELKIEHKVIDISGVISSFKGVVPCQSIVDNPSKDLHLALFERVGTAVVNTWANYNNYCAVSSSNKTELQTSFYSVGGNVAEIFPLAGLYKTEVRDLAWHLNIAPEIIHKSPSDGFNTRQPDELVLGLPYEAVDRVLFFLGIERTKAVQRQTGVSLGCIKDMEARIEDSKKKLEFPECKMHSPSLWWRRFWRFRKKLALDKVAEGQRELALKSLPKKTESPGGGYYYGG